MHCISIAGVVNPQTHVKGLQNRHDQRVPGVAWDETEENFFCPTEQLSAKSFFGQHSPKSKGNPGVK